MRSFAREAFVFFAGGLNSSVAREDYSLIIKMVNVVGKINDQINLKFVTASVV